MIIRKATDLTDISHSQVSENSLNKSELPSRAFTVSHRRYSTVSSAVQLR